MVLHGGSIIAPDLNDVPMTNNEIDRALLDLRDAEQETRVNVFRRLKRQDRVRVAERMRTRQPFDLDGDVLSQAQFFDVPSTPHAKRAVVFQCNAPFAEMTWQLIQSVRQHGNIDDAMTVVVASDDGAADFFRDKVGLVIYAPLVARPRNWMKCIVWSVARQIDAEYLITLESDMLCVGDLSGIWSALEASDQRTIHAVKGHFLDRHITLGKVLEHHAADPSDIAFITGEPAGKLSETNFLFNGGLFAGHRQAFIDAEARMRSYYPWSLLACEGWPFDHGDEFVSYLAINSLGFSSHLSPTYNGQVFLDGDTHGIRGWEPSVRDGKAVFTCAGHEAKLIHFVGQEPKERLLPRAAASLARTDLKAWEASEAFGSPEALRAFALGEALKVEGLLCEFGVGEGNSVKELACQTERTIYGFDSFEGLPEDWRPGFEKGKFACEIPSLPGNVELIVGEFKDTLGPFLDRHPAHLAFAHIDSDLYSSATTILKFFAPDLQPGTIFVFDEFFGYPTYGLHEHKAWYAFVKKSGVKFRFIGHVPTGQQAAIQIL